MIRNKSHKEEPKKTETSNACEINDEISKEEKAQVESLSDDITQMQAELGRLSKDANEFQDRYLRTLADFDNFRKRQRDETSRQISCAKENLISKLLPIFDNFERAVQAAEAKHSYESLLEGVSLTMRQLTDMLEKEGVTPISAVGEEFNPELHEAMMRECTDECPDNTVLEEFEKGYTLNGKLLRPARVKVAVKE